MKNPVLVGVSKFTSKAGKPFTVAFLSQDFNPADTAKGCFGQKIEQIFVPEEQLDYLKPEDLGKEITMDYVFYNGSPRVSVIHVVGKNK